MSQLKTNWDAKERSTKLLRVALLTGALFGVGAGGWVVGRSNKDKDEVPVPPSPSSTASSDPAPAPAPSVVVVIVPTSQPVPPQPPPPTQLLPHTRSPTNAPAMVAVLPPHKNSLPEATVRPSPEPPPPPSRDTMSRMAWDEVNKHLSKKKEAKQSGCQTVYGGTCL